MPNLQIETSGYPRIRRQCCAMFTILIVHFAVFTVEIAAQDVEILDVQVGIDEHFKIGCWAPLNFSIRATEPISDLVLRIRTVDPDGHAVYSSLPAVSLPGNSEKRFSTEFRSGRTEGAVLIEVTHQDRILASRTLRPGSGGNIASMQQNHHLWIVAGKQPAFEAAYQRSAEVDQDSVHLVKINDFSDWQPSAKALDGVDLIVINAGTAISESAAQSLRRWVIRGGRLVICIGADSETLKSGPLADWLPVMPRETFNIRSLDGLNALIPSGSRLRFSSIPGGVLDRTQGTVIATGLSSPLIVRASYGSGVSG